MSRAIAVDRLRVAHETGSMTEESSSEVRFVFKGQAVVRLWRELARVAYEVKPSAYCILGNKGHGSSGWGRYLGT